MGESSTMDDRNPDGDAPRTAGASEQTDYRAVSTDGARPARGTGSGRAAASRRRFLGVLGAGGVAALAGCAGNGQDDGTDNGTTDEPDGSDLQESLTISLGYTPNVVGEFWVNIYGMMPYFTAVVEPLVWVNDETELEPWLATDWEPTGDRTWEFTLREDVTFHNGEPFNAEAVVFSFGEIFEKFSNARGFTHIDGPDAVRPIDDQTVEFTTVDPYPNFPGQIAHNMAAMQAPQAVDVEDKPIGTGMFQMEEREKDQRAVVTAFDGYWRDADPTVGEITYRVIDDPSTRVLSLESHDVDIAYNLPTAPVNSLRQNEETDIHLQQRPQIIYVALNVHRSPTEDVRLRQALNYATDQDLLVDTIMEGIGTPATGPVPEIIYWSAHDEVRRYAPDGETFGQDFERARALVDDSDYDGETLEMLVNPRMALGSEIAEVVQDWYDQVGVDTDINRLEYAAFLERWAAGEAHLRVGDNGVFNGAPDFLMYGLFHTEDEENLVMAPGGELDELIERARQSRDRDEIVQYYTEAQKLLMEDAIVVPLYYDEYIVGSNRDVSGLHTPPIMQMVKWEDLEHREM